MTLAGIYRNICHVSTIRIRSKTDRPRPTIRPNAEWLVGRPFGPKRIFGRAVV